MIDKGHGPAVLMIHGIQGRWEWMSPAVDALATHAEIADTGHIGLVTKPERFSDIVGRFVTTHAKRVRVTLQVSA